VKVGETSLRRRLMELGLSSQHTIGFVQYSCGYTVEIRGATYAVDKRTVKIIRNLISES
jgi:hypothetical protein